VKTGEELALIAIEKELKRLTAVAAKAKADVEARDGAFTEQIEIHRQLSELSKSDLSIADSLSRLKVMQARTKKLVAIMKQDYMKLSDRQFNAELERDALQQYAVNLRFRIGLRSCN
jgi:hypothetical protein